MAPVDSDVLKPVAFKQWWSVSLHNESLAVVVLAVVLDVHRDDPKRFDAFTAVLLPETVSTYDRLRVSVSVGKEGGSLCIVCTKNSRHRCTF